eukprot:2175758-Prymnesium_polylepis.1
MSAVCAGVGFTPGLAGSCSLQGSLPERSKVPTTHATPTESRIESPRAECRRDAAPAGGVSDVREPHPLCLSRSPCTHRSTPTTTHTPTIARTHKRTNRVRDPHADTHVHTRHTGHTPHEVTRQQTALSPLGRTG